MTDDINCKLQDQCDRVVKPFTVHVFDQYFISNIVNRKAMILDNVQPRTKYRGLLELIRCLLHLEFEVDDKGNAFAYSWLR